MDHHHDVGRGVHVGADRAVLLGFRDVLREHREPRADELGDELAHLLGAIERFTQQEARARRVFDEEADRLVEDRVEAIFARGGPQQARQRLVPAREQRLEHRAMQHVLVRVVIEERLLLHADRVRDLLDRRRIETARREEPRGLAEDDGGSRRRRVDLFLDVFVLGGGHERSLPGGETNVYHLVGNLSSAVRARPGRLRDP